MSDRNSQALAILSKLSDTPVAELTPEKELVADLEIDSPKALQLLVDLEDTLGIEISDEDAARMNTVGDVLTYLKTK